ncbi:MAG: MlaC/ttg2D family ABC transporter substrate-binding protein [Myxococcota bacterium]
MRRTSSHATRAGILAALLCLLLAIPGTAPAESPAVALVSRTVVDVLAVLNDDSLDLAARRQKIEAIAYERFDFDTMSKLVVARHWKSFSAEQKVEFVEEFKAFLARSYGDRIKRYSDEQVEVVSETPLKRGDVKVMTAIVGGEFDGALVEYRLRQSDGAWRVIDVKVEGISLVLNYRDQFKAVLSRGGPDELLQQLKQKNTEA